MQAFKQRWVSGDLPEYYTKQDPAVKANRARAGEKIDYSSLFELGPAALWLMPKDAKMGDPAQPDTQISPIATRPQFDKILSLAAETADNFELDHSGGKSDDL